MTTVDAQHIRDLFLNRQPSYRLSEAARLLGMTRGALERHARSDQEDAYRTNGRWRFTWRQVAHLAVRRWTLAEIHEALGSDARKVLPPLLALREVTVRLPEYLVRAIEHTAVSSDRSVDDWLLHELMDFAGIVAHQMERAFPGYRRAYLFPGGEQTNDQDARRTVPISTLSSASLISKRPSGRIPLAQ
jgi:hypothetical protein